MPTRTINTSIKLDGEQEFKKQMSSVNSSLRTMKTEMQLLESEFKGQANSLTALTAKDKLLRQEQQQQTEKVKALERAVREATEAYGEGDQRVDQYQQQLNRAKARLNDLDGEIQKNGRYMEEAANSTDGCASSIDEYGREVQDAEKKAGTFGEVLKANLTAEAVIAGLKAIAGAVKQVGEALGETVTAAAEYGDNVDKMSQKMGMSSDAYQEWAFIMEHCGTSIDGLQSGMKTLATAAETGSDAFTKLGISQDQIANMSQEELFSATISALQNVSDETERTYLAGKLLGRGATELGPLLNTSAEETEAMRQQVHDLGGVMSEDAVKAAAAYQDSLQNLNAALDGAKNKVSGEFLPSITTMMDGLTMMLTGNVDEGIAMVEQGVQDFGATLEALGPYAEAALRALLETVSACLPDIVEAGGEVLISIVDGLMQAMPELVPVAVDVILTLVDTLINNIDVLIAAAIQLAVGIGTGIIRAIPQIAGKVPQIIAAIVRGLASGVGQVVSVGTQLVQGIWRGISSSLGWIKNQITGWVGNVVSFLKRLFKINSPSKLMEDEIGMNIGLGVGTGFVDAMSDVERMMADAMPDPADLLLESNMTISNGSPRAVGGAIAGGNIVAGPTVYYGGISIIIQGRDKDAAQLARELQIELERVISTWA